MIVQAAKLIAIREHAGQTYPPQKGPINFEMHLGHAVSVLWRYEVTDDYVHAATWLHDILEDTTMTEVSLVNELSKFGGAKASQVGEVIRIVQAVTDEPGVNRKERKAKTYPKIAKAGWRAVTVKLADRIANVEAALLGGRGNPHFLEQYIAEYDDFAKALMPVDKVESALWHYLEKLLDVR